ncbi:Type 1 glutamine amidotransferase-like domain-containing protein [Actinomadura rupiterrae]|uniref:Type 1 glutamine amidotransferase-like domain-containing protein n=1 Tax=Actinomadura rupiterrae TaxID=559627 RepID=UPI0020A50319|nr:Type 1 glutamine amidotransferase-like domain-containing protein [Actinomadura rupiterrae]MCP2335537.1 dipeptidase E [Actinomadura rupiterrae]
MRLYLSSFRLGENPERLLELCGDRREAAVIANALDGASEDVRSEGVRREIAALAGLGFAATEIDLREYFGRPGELAEALGPYAVLWVRGGNVFPLRYAMARSGADALVTKLVQDDAVVYAGYSAGACVLAPSLRGLEVCDDPSAAPEAIWDGLGVIDFAFVPHVDSPGHPECEALTRVADAYREAGVPYRALKDGQVLVLDGGGPPVLL